MTLCFSKGALYIQSLNYLYLLILSCIYKSSPSNQGVEIFLEKGLRMNYILSNNSNKLCRNIRKRNILLPKV